MAALLFSGGTVVLGNGRTTDAIAVEGELVVAIGQEAKERTATEVVDLAGRCLVPGFRDGHIHPLWGGVGLLGCDVTDAVDIHDAVARVRRHIEANPGTGWVVGGGYPPEILPGGRGDAHLLDAVAPDRPVFLWASDHHTMWVNSAALAAAGIDAGTPDPPLGHIARRPDGTPLGALLEAACHLVERRLPTMTAVEKADGLQLALQRMAASGIVWAQEAALEVDDITVYTDLAASGDLPADVNIALRVDPRRWAAQRSGFAAARTEATGVLGRAGVSTVKFFADGVIESGTGALLEPYSDDPCTCGIPNWTPEGLAEAAAAFDADGFQLHIHAIGDAGVRMALDAVAHTAAVNGRRDRRPVIAHTHLVHPEDLHRFATLGVVANFEPLWARQNAIMTELTEPRLGPERSRWQYPIASVAASGATVSFGSDWPVSSMVPMEGLAVAVHRQTRDGHPSGGWLPEQRVGLTQALAAYARGTAIQAGDDHAGTLVPGAPADAALLEADITTMAPNELADVVVDGTWLRGTEVFRH